MNTRRNPREVARDIAQRASGKYRIGAVAWDSRGNFAWGWCHPKSIRAKEIESEHAEEYLIRRANRRRLRGANLTVYGEKHGKHGFIKVLMTKPCIGRCEPLLKKNAICTVEFSDPTARDGWRRLRLIYIEEAQG